MSYIGKTPTSVPLTSSDITDSIISLPKLTDGTDGNLISYDTSGNPVAVATGNDGQVLTSAGAGAPPVFETLPVGGITIADQWRLTTDFSGDADPLSANLERIDTSGQGTIGSAMTVSSGIFTFPSTGIYLVTFTVSGYYNGENHYATGVVQVTTNNSSYTNVAAGENGHGPTGGSNIYELTTISTLIDVTNTSNVKVKFKIDNQNNSANIMGNPNGSTYTNMMFIRLGDT